MIKTKYHITEKINKKVIKEILSIEKQKGLTAETIIAQAKNKTSPLHNFFEWEDSVAGENWRLHQARMLINEVKIIVGERVVSAYENIDVSVDENSNREYKPFKEIITNKTYRLQMIKRAIDSIAYWREQNAIYSELNPIFVAIDKTKKKLEKKRWWN